MHWCIRDSMGYKFTWMLLVPFVEKIPSKSTFKDEVDSIWTSLVENYINIDEVLLHSSPCSMIFEQCISILTYKMCFMFTTGLVIMLPVQNKVEMILVADLYL